LQSRCDGRGRVNSKGQFRAKGKYFLCLLIGTFCMAIGLALRLSFRNNVHSLGGYIAMYMFVVSMVAAAIVVCA
jgi:hypothetical protein